MVEADGRVIGVEVKSGATVASDFFGNLADFDRCMAQREEVGDLVLRPVCGGEATQTRYDIDVVPLLASTPRS